MSERNQEDERDDSQVQDASVEPEPTPEATPAPTPVNSDYLVDSITAVLEGQRQTNQLLQQFISANAQPSTPPQESETINEDVEEKTAIDDTIDKEAAEMMKGL